MAGSSTAGLTTVSSSSSTLSSSTLSSSEVEKFGALSSTWWSSGDFDSASGLPRNTLREMNPCRVSFILRTLRDAKVLSESVRVLPLASANLPGTTTFLDVGGGGGILAESLLRLGLPPDQLSCAEPSKDLVAAMLDRLESHGLVGSSTASRPSVHSGPIETLPPSTQTEVTLLEVIDAAMTPFAWDAGLRSQSCLRVTKVFRAPRSLKEPVN